MYVGIMPLRGEKKFRDECCLSSITDIWSILLMSAYFMAQ